MYRQKICYLQDKLKEERINLQVMHIKKEKK